jgi:hypothetical protein
MFRLSLLYAISWHSVCQENAFSHALLPRLEVISTADLLG